MTELYKSLSGTWDKQIDDSLIGKADASLSARAIAGLAEDQNYEFLATIEINTGKVCLIANHGYNVSSEEEYIEMVLDPTGNTVKLDKVVRNVDGSEKSRTELDSYSMAIAVGTEYRLRIKSVEYETGKFAVYGYVNDFLVVQKEDTGTGFEKGQHGMECLGTADQYSQFSQRFFQERNLYTTLDNVIAEIRSISRKELVGKDGSIQNYYDKIATYISEASKFIDGECERQNSFFQNGAIELTDYHDGTGSSPPKGMYQFSEEVEAYEERAGIIFTKQRPIVSVTSIHENKGAIGESDNWQEITAYRWFKHGEVVFASGSIPPKGKKNIRIIYKAGYAKTPVDIQMACTRLIVNLIHKQISDRTATFVSFTRPTAVNFAMPDVFTPDIKSIFLRYKLAGFGEL